MSLNLGLDNVLNSENSYMDREDLTEILDSIYYSNISDIRSFENLIELRQLVKLGKQDAVKCIVGRDVSLEELDGLVYQSTEDAWSTIANIVGGTGKFLGGTLNILINEYLESTGRLKKRLKEETDRLKGYKIQDSDVYNQRAATLRPYDVFVKRYNSMMQAMKLFPTITSKNIDTVGPKILEYYKDFEIKGFANLKDHLAVTSDKAGRLGWNGNTTTKAIAMANNLLSIRPYGRNISSPEREKVKDQIDAAGKSFKYKFSIVNKMYWNMYYESGRMIRALVKMLSKINK